MAARIDRGDVAGRAGRRDRAHAGVLHHRRGRPAGAGAGAAGRAAGVDEAQPQAAAADRVAVLEQVALDPLLLEVHAVRRRQILEDVAAAAPEDPRVVARHHRVVGADRAVHRAADPDLGRGQIERALDALRIAPEKPWHVSEKVSQAGRIHKFATRRSGHRGKCSAMCGVFGIHGHDEAANIAYLGMHALQHRGQESAGLVAVDDGRLRRHVAMGLVSDAFDRDDLAKLPGHAGHRPRPLLDRRQLASCATPSRSCSSTPAARSRSPTTATWSTRPSCAPSSRRTGSIFQTSSDTEVIVHLMAKAPRARRRSASSQAALRRVARRVLARLPDRATAR